MPNFIFSAGRTAVMSDVRSLYVAGRMLVHVVGLQPDEVRCVAVLRVAVGAVHPCAFRVGVHHRHVKVLVAVRLGVV